MLLLIKMPGIPDPSSGRPGEVGANRQVTPLSDNPVWTDSLDGLGNVYVPPGGLEGVEVSGGEVHLLPGHDTGWVASSIITCPEGFRYNMVLVEADLPGSSGIRLSVLNASRPPVNPGYANETILGLDRIGVTELYIDYVDPLEYPLIRIQVDLVASGGDRPRLLSWSLYYAGYNEWRDDYLNRLRVHMSKGINLSEGSVGLNISSNRYGSAAKDYEAYPPIFTTRWRQGAFISTLWALYPNATRTGYNDRSSLYCRGTYDVEFEDLNGDGYLDLVCANTDRQYALDSEIWWGRPSGRWSRSGYTTLAAGRAYRVTTGDLNGDGWPDIAFSYHQVEGGDPGISVFLNRGGGAFSYMPDITLPMGMTVRAGDLNGDGFDDLMATGCPNDESRVYFGGPNGPDATADITFTEGSASYESNDCLIYDLDGDGHLDVVIACTLNGKVHVFKGNFAGPDAFADHQLSVTGYCYACAAGDVNGDGRTDLVLSLWDKLRVFEGTASGWSDSDMHDISNPDCHGWAMDVRDLDRDGYDDIMLGPKADDSKLQIFLGNSTWPTGPDIERTRFDNPQHLDVGVPKRLGPRYVGVYITNGISLPRNCKWTELRLEGDLPEGTTMRLSVLDSSMREIQGFTDLPDWTVDLSGGTLPGRIHVRVTLTSGSNATTPLIDSLTVGWRRLQSPVVNGLDLNVSSVHRTGKVNLTFNVTDEFDPSQDLDVTVAYRKSGTPIWSTSLISGLGYREGNWSAVLTTTTSIPVGMYELAVQATDSDGWTSGYIAFPDVLEVLNNVPTAPMVGIVPEYPDTRAGLTARVTALSTDIETTELEYRFRWFRDGDRVEGVIGGSVLPELTSKGENWSVEVRAFDGDDEGPPAMAWTVIRNSAPEQAVPMLGPTFDEDTTSSGDLDLSQAFWDPDDDPLFWYVHPEPVHLEVSIDQSTGLGTFVPDANWSGEVNVTFFASDGDLNTSQPVKVTVRPVDDPPRFVAVNGEPIVNGCVDLTVLQDETLVVDVEVFDIEDDEVSFRATTTQVDVNTTTGQVRWWPGNDDIGWLNFTLKVNEVAHPLLGDEVSFNVLVLNANDEPSEPVMDITSGRYRFKEGENVTFQGSCDDLDLVHGQVLNFSWSSNISGHLGYGEQITVFNIEAGVHLVTLTVRDPDYEKSVTMEIMVDEVVEPGPPDDGDTKEEQGLPTWLLPLILVLMIALLVGGYIVRSRGRG